jgi:hypothetical protein
MWHLKMADRGGPWLTVDSFDTVTGAARKIIELGSLSGVRCVF